MTLVAVQVQLGEIKGILTTVVNEHSRRIAESEAFGRQLRIDLTAVNDNAIKRTADLKAEVNTMAETGRKEGNLILQELNTKVTTNTNHIHELREDQKEIKEKQNATFGRVMLVLSPIIAAAALLWNVVGGK